MAYTTIDKPSDYFETKLWSGNATDDRAISGLDFAPNWVWIKNRTDSNSHAIFDTVRGATKYIESDTTDAEATGATFLKSFTSDGYTLGTAGRVNSSGNNYVGWNWKAGTSFTNDASATGIGTIDSTGSVSDASGFSIVSYTGTGSAGTIKHGLSTVPHMIIQKNLTSGTHAWNVYHKNLTSAGYNLNLNDTYAEFTSATTWNSTAPTSSVFSVGTDTNANESGSGHIAYCFAEKQGYSKFGSYTGNGNADGTFVYTGFKPAFVLIKVTSTTNDWEIHDNKRGSSNVINAILQPNLSDAESTSGREIDFLSNGFKLRNSNSQNNLSGGTFIYMCFASNPFTTSSGVPTTAR